MISPPEPSGLPDRPVVAVRRAADGTVALVGGQPRLELRDHVQETGPGPYPGEFLRWQFDEDSGTVLVEASRYGMFPCYYASTETEFIASTAIQPVVDRLDSITFDDDAMACVIRFVCLIGADTPFREVSALEPGTRLRWTRGRLEKDRDQFAPERRRLSRDAALDEFNERFAEAVRRRRVSGDFVLPLTGGRDSRHILFELMRLDARPALCLTRGPSPGEFGDDGKVAAELCRRFGLPHDLAPVSRTLARIAVEKNERTSFVIAGQHLVATEVARALLDRGRPVFDGIGGDVMIQGNWLDVPRWERLQAGDIDGLIELMLTPELWHEHLLSTEVRERWGRDRAVARLRRELERYLDEPNPVSAFAFANYTRRGVGAYTFGMLGVRLDVACPYLDPDVHEFLRSLDGALFLDGKFHDAAIARAHPRWAGIPYERKGLPRARTWNKRHGGLVSGWLALTRAHGVIRPGGVARETLVRALKGDEHPWLLLYLGQLLGYARRSGLDESGFPG